MVARCTGVLHAIIIRDGDQANMALRLDSDALAQAAPLEIPLAVMVIADVTSVLALHGQLSYPSISLTSIIY